jgi:hypothetical protein
MLAKALVGVLSGFAALALCACGGGGGGGGGGGPTPDQIVANANQLVAELNASTHDQWGVVKGNTAVSNNYAVIEDFTNNKTLTVVNMAGFNSSLNPMSYFNSNTVDTVTQYGGGNYLGSDGQTVYSEQAGVGKDVGHGRAEQVAQRTAHIAGVLQTQFSFSNSNAALRAAGAIVAYHNEASRRAMMVADVSSLLKSVTGASLEEAVEAVSDPGLRPAVLEKANLSGFGRTPDETAAVVQRVILSM